MRDYVVIYEPGEAGEEPWGAYVPDLPGCISTGSSLEEAERNIREAIAGHIAALRETGQPVQEPASRAARVSVAA